MMMMKPRAMRAQRFVGGGGPVGEASGEWVFEQLPVYLSLFACNKEATNYLLARQSRCGHVTWRLCAFSDFAFVSRWWATGTGLLSQKVFFSLPHRQVHNFFFRIVFYLILI